MEGDSVDHMACVLGMDPAAVLKRSSAHCLSNCMSLLQAVYVRKEDDAGGQEARPRAEALS